MTSGSIGAQRPGTPLARSYLDHAATTPMRPEAVHAVTAELSRLGNPSSLHAAGRAARRVVEEARESIAECLGAQPSEVVFTSGGTEADNLAVKGAYWAGQDAGRDGVAISPTEHHAISDAVDWLERHCAARVTRVPVDGIGRVQLPALAAVVDERTAVVSVIWGNNEIGTVNPVVEVAELARAAGAVSHSDAVQVAGQLPLDFAASGLDLVSVTAHKVGGPVGIGALLARREVVLAPLLHGGGQERDVRSGTLDSVGAAGFAAALRAAHAELTEQYARVAALRDRLAAGIRTVLPDVVLHSALEESPAPGSHSPLLLPGILSVEIPGVLADGLLLLLDRAGIDCSAGSACNAGVTQPSHVLLALGLSDAAARSTVRFSLGRTSTEADVDAVCAALPVAVARARAAAAYA